MNKRKELFKKIYQGYMQQMKWESEDFSLINPKYINSKIINKFIPSNEFETIKKIFNHPRFKENININANNGLMLQEAAKVKNLEMFKFLMENGATIDENNDVIIVANATIWKNREVLQYIIFDKKIKLNESSLRSLSEMVSFGEVKKMIESRDLNQTLETYISTKDVLEKRFKI